MKKILITTAILLIFSFTNAQESSFGNKFLRFSLGYLTGHIAHESGHQVAAWIWNVPIEYSIEPYPSYLKWSVKNPQFVLRHCPNNPNLVYWEETPSHSTSMVALGGFGGEVISAEVILAISSLKHDDGEYNYYLLGWLTQTVVNSIVYTIWCNSSHHSTDYTVLSVWHKSELVKGFMLTHAAVTALRTILKLSENDNFQIYSTNQSIEIQFSF